MNNCGGRQAAWGWLPCQHLPPAHTHAARSSHRRSGPFGTGAPKLINVRPRRLSFPEPPAPALSSPPQMLTALPVSFSSDFLLFRVILPLSLNAFSPYLLLLSSPLLVTPLSTFPTKSAGMDQSARIHPDRTARELYLTAAEMWEPALKAKYMENPQQELKILSSKKQKQKNTKPNKKTPTNNRVNRNKNPARHVVTVGA